MSVRVIFLLMILFLTSIQQSFSNTEKGKNISDKIYETLVKNNFTNISKSKIVATGQDEFAYNISVEFSANKNEGVIDDEVETVFRQTMILNFFQEDFLERKNEFLNFLQYLKDSQKNPVNIQIYFSAFDKEIINSKGLSGSEVLITNIDDTDSIFVVCLDFSSSSKNKILTGSKGRNSPFWLSKQIIDSFLNSNIPFEIEHKFSSLYRLGILKGESRMKKLIDNNIPAITIILKDDEEKSGFEFLKFFTQNIDVSQSDKWDTHYICLQLSQPLKTIWINEQFFLYISLFVVTFSLFLICGFSFTGKFGLQRKTDFIRTIYMIPFSIGFLSFSIIFSQWIIQKVDFFENFSPIFQFNFKIIFSIIFVSILFAFQELIRLPITNFIYGYIILFIATLNIFIYSAIDILFFGIFGAEYLIIYFARHVKKIPFLIFWTIIMFLPFVPYVFIIIQKANENILSKIVFCSYYHNVILSFALFPFFVMWQRILIRINIKLGIKGFSPFGIFLRGTIAIILMISFYLSAIFYIEKKFYVKNIENRTSITENKEEKSFSVKIIENNFIGMSTNHIKINSKKEILQYKVFIKSDEKFPIYESTYDYSISNENEVSFTIPNYPPKEITIDYAADSKLSLEITVIALFFEKDKLYFDVLREKIEKNEDKK